MKKIQSNESLEPMSKFVVCDAVIVSLFRSFRLGSRALRPLEQDPAWLPAFPAEGANAKTRQSQRTLSAERWIWPVRTWLRGPFRPPLGSRNATRTSTRQLTRSRYRHPRRV